MADTGAPEQGQYLLSHCERARVRCDPCLSSWKPYQTYARGTQYESDSGAPAIG